MDQFQPIPAKTNNKLHHAMPRGGGEEESGNVNICFMQCMVKIILKKGEIL